MPMPTDSQQSVNPPRCERVPYTSPCLTEYGDIAELTHAFVAGSPTDGGIFPDDNTA